MTASKIVAAAASGVGGAGLDVDEVFSTYCYTGDSSSGNEITGIDTLNEGGLVWLRWRSGSNAFGNAFYDTARGNTKQLRGDTSAAESTESRFTGFLANGFSLSGDTELDYNNNKYVAWTFRKAPKFFDIVLYTGNGTAGRTISHNLGSTPGMIIVKSRSSSGDSAVYHRGIYHNSPEDYFLSLNGTDQKVDNINRWNDTAPTSAEFTVGDSIRVNENNTTYVAYLFAHNDSGDGEFGTDNDQDIIKCDGYVGNGSTTGSVINLGFEPQWVMIKNTDGASSWQIFDNMRGTYTAASVNDHVLYADNANAEYSSERYLSFTATGFSLESANSEVNQNGHRYTYVAIRRGPLAVPEDATKVFHVNAFTGNGATGRKMTTNFIVDLNLTRGRANSHNPCLGTRLTDGMFETNSSAIHYDTLSAWIDYDFSDGYEYPTVYSYSNDNLKPYIAYSWRRAPSFCDVVCYDGNGSTSQNVSHNLGVAPEMIWVKCRSHTEDWIVYHSSTGNGKYLSLNTTGAAANWTGAWNATSPTGSVFTVGNGNAVNVSGRNYVAHLFATAPGVSKVGSYTGNGSSQNIDCGFSSGARFVLIKRTNSVGSWWTFDSVRGIVTGNDSNLYLDSNDAAVTSLDLIDPHSSGFALPNAYTNASGDSYIFYAIA